MSNPIGHHYLPRQAYLRQFSITNREGFVYLYKRGAWPTEVNINNAGKERYLYSLEKDGVRSHEIETRLFSAIDGDAVPLLNKLNSESGCRFLLSQDELSIFVGFIAYQLIRTPAFRDLRMRLFAGAVRDARRVSPKDLRRTLPPGLISDSIRSSDQKLKASWQAAMKELSGRAEDKEIWLNQLQPLAQRIFGELWNKPITILHAQNYCFFTCDHPVAINYQTGIRLSEVFVPIGARRAVLFSASVARRPFDQFFAIPIRTVSGIETGRLNRRTIHSAEKYLFGPSARNAVSRFFSRTRQPTRFKNPKAKEILGL